MQHTYTNCNTLTVTRRNMQEKFKSNNREKIRAVRCQFTWFL